MGTVVHLDRHRTPPITMGLFPDERGKTVLWVWNGKLDRRTLARKVNSRLTSILCAGSSAEALQVGFTIRHLHWLAERFAHYGDKTLIALVQAAFDHETHKADLKRFDQALEAYQTLTRWLLRHPAVELTDEVGTLLGNT